ncbi:hypothetical protein MX629_03905 [Carnobacterium divergens]|uniref:Lipoprotein n=1 Tax=Carnobacterium divergens TaxID=2748 RepID=A0AAW8R7U4_CARDV|nr:hypothetical protein [Carnobacterium divergens]MDT1957566.1 hypothetical protein [Carnobacterium divergens]MDT1973769.1 hypothetical protein [Carnobacterium divergens]
MKNKKLITIISVLFILLIGGATFYAFNKAQDDRQEKMELVQKKIDKENKKKQDKIVAEKKKLEEEKKKLEEEQKAKQDELDRLQAEKESIAQENERSKQAAQEQKVQVVQQPTAQPEAPAVTTPPTSDNQDSSSQLKHPENLEKPFYTWDQAQKDGLSSAEYQKKIEEMYQ